MTLPQPCTTRDLQGGAALVVSLILLLVMTIAGVTAMNSSRLQISMAGLMQEEEVALRRSERALALAEAHIETNAKLVGFGDGANGYYSAVKDTVVASATDWPDGTVDNNTVLGTLNAKDEFVVEKLGDAYYVIDGPDGDTGMEKVAGCCAYAYRITIRSATDGKTVRIIESLYAIDAL